MHPMKLKVLKSWISQDFCIVFQCQNPLAGSDEGQPKKIHLIIDLKQTSFELRLSNEKPEDAHSNHAFVQILRKQCPSITIKEIQSSPEKDFIYFYLLGTSSEEGKPWKLVFQKVRPPLASLLSPDNTVFVSYGQKGTFTKRHPYKEASPETLPTKDILPDLFLHFIGNKIPTENKREEIISENSQEYHHSKSQKDLISRLKRKQKTIKKTLEKIQKNLPSIVEVEKQELHAQLLQTYEIGRAHV
jgi:hypothetical protein